MKTIYSIILAFTLCQCSAPVFRQKTVDVATTAYTSKERDHLKYGIKTAAGTQLAVNKSAASDWSVFPVGTKLEINHIVYEIDDYGSALVAKTRKGLPIVDIYQPTRKQMNKWGVRFFTGVKVIQWGSYEKSLTILQSRLKYSHCRQMYQQIKNKI
jgi:3D (Asp-Asp-Asp) domain-containing protein